VLDDDKKKSIERAIDDMNGMINQITYLCVCVVEKINTCENDFDKILINFYSYIMISSRNSMQF
jgi:hypothetical protein